MKKTLIQSMFIATTLSFFTACDSQKPVDELLKNDSQRSEIINSFINHQTYRMEMMNAMMENDSSRNIMGQKMMGRTEMMMNDPTTIKGTMNHMVTMAASDSTLYDAMIQMMKDQPEMWSKVMKMNITKTN
jgi:flavoprotein